MRYSNGCVLFVTQKEPFEGKLPVGIEKQSLWYHLCRFLCLFFALLASPRLHCPFWKKIGLSSLMRGFKKKKSDA